jgi:hypothetical protein
LNIIGGLSFSKMAVKPGRLMIAPFGRLKLVSTPPSAAYQHAVLKTAFSTLPCGQLVIISACRRSALLARLALCKRAFTGRSSVMRCGATNRVLVADWLTSHLAKPDGVLKGAKRRADKRRR